MLVYLWMYGCERVCEYVSVLMDVSMLVYLWM